MIAPAPGTQPGRMVADRSEMVRALALFTAGYECVELVALKSGQRRTTSADPEALASIAGGMPDGNGIYFRLNPVKPGLGDHAKNGDILRREWLYIDVDPLKAAGFTDDSATDAEKAGAGGVADAVVGRLSDRGWPAPVVVDSGNGYGLFYKCALPNDELVRASYSALLRALAIEFERQPADVDKAVHNANRLVKVPGTWARKGTESADRPHRICRLVSVPGTIGTVSFEQLAAAGVSEPVGPKPSTNGTHAVSTEPIPNGSKAHYGRAGLDRECQRVALTAWPGRNNILNEAAFKIGTMVPVNAFALDESFVTERLFQAACLAGLDTDPGCGESGIRSTIKSGLRAGKLKPRELPNGKSVAPALRGSAPPTDSTESVVYWASSVTPRKVEWLWPARIPLGKLTTFAGNGGLGKTFVLCDIIARVTRGAEWPDKCGHAPKGKCLFISGEDDPEDTLVPRLIEVGADLSRVAFLKTQSLDRFQLADLKTLDRALETMGPETRFVAIDPPTAYLGGVDDHKNAELRSILSPLASWSSKHQLSTTFNTHVNKPQGSKVEAMMRVMGSVAWVNGVRSAYMFAKDPHDLERRLFIGMKNNLGKEVKGLAYRIASLPNGEAKVEWLGEVDTSADEAMNGSGTKKRRVKASALLEELFAARERIPSKDVYKAAEKTTISKDALKEAKDDMGIRAKQEYDDDTNMWFWYWPMDDRATWVKKKEKAEGQP